MRAEFFFQKHKPKVVIYLFNYNSSKSFFFVLNMAFDVLLSTVLGIPEKETRDPGIGTWHPCIGPWTQDPPPGTLHLGPAVRDLHMEPGTWDPRH